MMKYIQRSIFLVAVLGFTIFGFNTASAAGTPPEIKNSNVADVALYTYVSECDAMKKASKPQSIIFNENATQFDDVYFYIHGTGAPSPKKYCTGTYGLCNHAKKGRETSIFFAFALTGSSGADWISKMNFTCMYNEAVEKLLELKSMKADPKFEMPKDKILAGFSNAGGAIKKILTKNQYPAGGFISTLSFDACYVGWCTPVAKVSPSIRGDMYIYTSNSKNSKGGPGPHAGALRALKATTENIKHVHVSGEGHGTIPRICFGDHYKNDHCEGKGKLGADTADGSGGTSYGDIVLEAKPLTKEEIKDLLRTPVPRIKIPGLSFSNSILDEAASDFGKDGRVYLSVPFLGEYISAIFQYAVIFISILALAMLIVSGIQWIIGGNKSEARENIRKRILSSIIGLVMSVGSYTVLYIVNPELIKFESLQILLINKIPFPEIVWESVDTGYDADSSIASKVGSVGEVNSTFFMTTGINGKKSNGWTIWQGLSPAQKSEVLPYLYKQVAPNCPEGHLVTIKDIPGWNNKKIHPAALEAFRKVNKTAADAGFRLVPGGVHRAAKKMVPLWNTGVVARYTQGRKWKANEGKIAKPTCKTGHSMGAAVDANMVHIKTNKRLAASDTSQITRKNYAKKFLGNPYKIILEQIFHQNGWVRYCAEHWHFEYGVTPRVKKWDKQARCWQHKSTFEQPIPDHMIKKVNDIIGFDFIK